MRGSWDFYFQFAFRFTSSNYPVPPVYSCFRFFYLILAAAGSINRCVLWTNANYPVRVIFHQQSLKCPLELVSLLCCLLPSFQTLCCSDPLETCCDSPPVLKGGGSSGLNNNRLVFFIFAISKVFKTAVSDWLRQFLEREGLLSDHQYGHRPHLLVLVAYSRSASLDNHGETHLVSLDISSVFDLVWQEGVTMKVTTFGLSLVLASRTSSFFNKQTTSVRVNETLSQPFAIYAGTPQGSLLAPIFLLFTGGLPTSNPIHSSSDDVILHCSFC